MLKEINIESLLEGKQVYSLLKKVYILVICSAIRKLKSLNLNYLGLEGIY